MFLCEELWRMYSRHRKMAATSAHDIEKELRNRSAVVLVVDRKGAADFVARLGTVGETMSIICVFLKGIFWRLNWSGIFVVDLMLVGRIYFWMNEGLV